MKDSVILGTGNSRYLKSVSDFKSLYPTYDDFVAALVAGTLPVDFNGINPAGFQQVGDALGKATLLKDYTAGLLKLSNTAVPDDAFMALLIGVGYYGYRVKVQLSDGTPAVGATVSGISALTGSSLVTGDDGVVIGKSTSKSVTIGCTSPYIDQAAPSSQSVTATGTITDVTLTLTAITDMITVTSSKTAKVSPIAKTMDVTAVGGGGGGGGGHTNGDTDTFGVQEGGGGGGGYVSTLLNVALNAGKLALIIGSGGEHGSYGNSGASDGADGGSTIVKYNDNNILTANGGLRGKTGYKKVYQYGSNVPGGAGNGNGGDGKYSGTKEESCGKNGTGYIFNDSSLGLAGGGGGGGGIGNPDSQSPTINVGGNPFGANGAFNSGGTYPIAGAASQPTGAGGGGGGGRYGQSPSSGKDGCIYVRFRFAS